MPLYACMKLVIISVCWGENGGEALVMVLYPLRVFVYVPSEV